MTSIHLPGVSGGGYADYGRKTVPEMIKLIRDHAEEMQKQAQAILEAKDDDFHIDTYLGVYARRNRVVLQIGRKYFSA